MPVDEVRLYKLDYSKPSGSIRIGEYDVPLPAMPLQRDMVNYGLKQSEQKFHRTEIPKSLLRRKAFLTPDEKQWIYNEYHKRFNGVWILINGKAIYLTGPYYDFLNYWITKNGTHPDFRYEQCRIYQFWDMVVRNPNAYGMFLIKPRRVGGTEITLHLEYEFGSRVKNVKCGMQSKNDNSASVNFKRLTRAHKKRIWFMKPIHKGSDDPSEALEFSYPITLQTSKKLKEMAEAGEDAAVNYSHEELGSTIDFGPSVAVHYDGEELNRYILNEFGKLEKMSALDCWDKVKPCLHYDHGMTIVGKAMFESTIEEINDEQIEEMTELWTESDPGNVNEFGRTTSGLLRLFISAPECSNHDAFGFPKVEENIRRLNAEFDAFKKRGEMKKLASAKRKTPMNVEDALTPSGNQSAFNKENLDDIYQRLMFPEDRTIPFTVRGNFKWKGGVVDSKVYFEPDAEGKFLVRELLKDGEDNKYVIMGGEKFPANVGRFRGGCDPYEHEEVADKKRASKGAGVIMSMYDDLKDGGKIIDGMPDDRGWDWLSKCPVAIYCARPDDPDEFFEDMLMMHVYYGTQMLVENNKQSIKKHFKSRKYKQYVMLRPHETIEENSRQKQMSGIPATSDTIEQYFNAIAHYVMHYSNAIKFIELVVDLQQLNRKNRTKHDLGVAFGWALLACDNKMLNNPRLTDQETLKESDWFEHVAA